jgi:hypothetical protein
MSDTAINSTSNRWAVVKKISALATLMLALTIPVLAAPRTQLTPDIHDVFQDGVWAGIIFVPAYEEGAVNYVEHWVLFDNFIYVGKVPTMRTTIVLSQLKFENENDFFARVPWGPGYRYVRVDCTDTDRLPGRKASETVPRTQATKQKEKRAIARERMLVGLQN